MRPRLAVGHDVTELKRAEEERVDDREPAVARERIQSIDLEISRALNVGDSKLHFSPLPARRPRV